MNSKTKIPTRDRDKNKFKDKTKLYKLSYVTE